jgi:hypothetical protein
MSLNPQYLFKTRYDLSPSDLKIYKKYSNSPIQRITICRTPLDKKIGMALNIITLGQWEKSMAKSSYDTLFHLFMLINLTSGVQLLLERNETVRLRLIKKGDVTPKTETMPVSGYGANSLTLQTLYQTTLSSMGQDLFYTYDAFQNNCQNFILNVLGANNLLTPELNTFILQNIQSIVEDAPKFLPKLANGITTFARKARELFGLGLKFH